MSSPVILCGSRREHPVSSVPVGSPAFDEHSSITLLLRRRTPAPESIEQPLSHDEHAAAHGADPADIVAVEAFAAEHGFTVTAMHLGARTVTISGPLSKLAHCFGAKLEMREIAGSVRRTREGDLHVPAELQESLVAVLGFDQRPIASTNHRVHPNAAQPASFTPPQLARIYNFPAGSGANQTIALIELDGGYNDSDLTSYWKQIGVAPVSVTSIGVDGAQNAPTGDPNGPDGEVALDIEVAGGVAPGARIAVYFASNTDQGFLDGINAAIHDSVNKPSVISISWGSAEDQWTGQAKNAFNAAFHDAALLGITVLAAAGDDGSADGDPSGKHVDFPASSPWVLACGGTSLVAKNGTRVSETVWNDGTNGGATGGGVSAFFSCPTYQKKAHVPGPAVPGGNKTGRGVPDVAAVADPNTGYNVFLEGQGTVIGGTSAVAPLWAGLSALCNEQLGSNLGWLHPVLYGTVAQQKVLHDIVSGTNGAFKAIVGWDCCTGLGTPDGQALLNVLKQTQK
jgi:kumamolisin